MKMPLLRDVVFGAIRMLEEAGPRRIHTRSSQPPVLFSTDGAVEGDLITHGVVIFDQLRKVVKSPNVSLVCSEGYLGKGPQGKACNVVLQQRVR